jgi:hypothetical protein
MTYRLAGIERNVVINWIEDALNADKPLSWLTVESIRGKGQSATTTQRGTYDSVTLEQCPSAEFILDDVLDTYAHFGTRLQLRAVFQNEAGEDDWEHTLTKRLNLISEPVGTRTGSSGPDAATERLSQSLAQGFDTLVARNEEAQARTLDVLQNNGATVERYMERMLTLQAEGANVATSQAIAISDIQAQKELAEFKIELLLQDQENSLGQILMESMPAILNSPLIANLADLISAFAKSVSKGAPALESAEGSPPPAEGAEPAAAEESQAPPA